MRKICITIAVLFVGSIMNNFENIYITTFLRVLSIILLIIFVREMLKWDFNKKK